MALQRASEPSVGASRVHPAATAAPPAVDCNKRYHYENWDRHMEQIRRRNRERIARSKQAVLDHLREHPCVDCGETDVVVLEFDHVGHKKANISLLMKSAETKRVLEEIEQCEVRCANCHRRVTAERGGWWRTKL